MLGDIKRGLSLFFPPQFTHGAISEPIAPEIKPAIAGIINFDNSISMGWFFEANGPGKPIPLHTSPRPAELPGVASTLDKDGWSASAGSALCPAELFVGQEAVGGSGFCPVT